MTTRLRPARLGLWSTAILDSHRKMVLRHGERNEDRIKAQRKPSGARVIPGRFLPAMFMAEERRQGLLITKELLSGKNTMECCLLEPTRNVVFGYKPQPQSAGFALERFDFFGSNPTGKFYGVDFAQTNARNSEARFQFRPSDIAIGTDGAIYVADWFDTRVGGHGAYDEKGVGSIYRITRKGEEMKAPKIDYSTTKGLIEAFKNPSHNVRGAAFYGLREKGASAASAVAKLLDDDNPYVQARAVFLLPHLGQRGVKLAEERLKHADPQMRIAAFEPFDRREATTCRMLRVWPRFLACRS